jgi:hypothetical protein
MNGKIFLVFAPVLSLGLLVVISCTKTGAGRQLMSIGCDTCSNSLQVTKEVILYLDSSDWVDKSNGKFDCDLVPLLAVSASPIDSFAIEAIYVGLGRSGKKIIQATPVNYDGGTIAWMSFLLSFQAATGQKAPQSLTIRVQLQWI